MDVKEYIKENESRFLDELFSLIRIPSISAKPEHRDDMLACASRWKELLLEAGADEAMVMPSQGNPLVYAEKRVSPDAPTVLVYAHYDVMPAEPLELWKSDPFEPEVRDGHIFARGADDDKGQSFIQVKAFEYMVRHGELKHNVKFIFEGEEEIGSPSLNAFLKEHRELLKADVILVSDTSMLGADLPSLTTGLRGLAYWEIEVTGPNRDLHSGHFGGAVANPINVLCKMLAQVTDADGRITIPHFYDRVEPVPEAERRMIAQIPFDEARYKAAIGVDELQGEKGYSTLERNSCRPSFDICGIWGGYTGEGSKTVLPSTAHAKVSCRLVPHQQHEEISRLFVDYIQSIAPRSVRVKVTPMHGGERRERFHQSIRQAPLGRAPRWQHPHHLRLRAHPWYQDRPDGLRIGKQRHPFTQRKHPARHLAQRHRSRRRVPQTELLTPKPRQGSIAFSEQYPHE